MHRDLLAHSILVSRIKTVGVSATSRTTTDFFVHRVSSLAI